MCCTSVLSYTELQTAIADLTFLVNNGRFNHLDGSTAVRPGGGFTYNLRGGPSMTLRIPQVIATARAVEIHEQDRQGDDLCRNTIARQQKSPTSPALRRKPLATPLLARIEIRRVRKQSSCHPRRSCLFHSVLSVWRTSSIKRPLARVPKEDLVFDFKFCVGLPASLLDIGSLVAMNRTLYERARDMGGTCLTHYRDFVFAG